MSHVTIGKWGKSLAVRIPSDIACEAGLKEGARVDVETVDGNIVIRRTTARFTLAELFQGKSPEKWRSAYAGTFDWGPDVGREIVEQ
jgi:antitoxin MazE